MNTLDISQWEGKKQRLQTRINNYVKQADPLPNQLAMTLVQYEMLKKTPEFGDRAELEMFKPEDRIYHTKYNCFEIVIV